MLRLPSPELLHPAEVLSPESSNKAPSAKTADDINDLFNKVDVEEPKEPKKEPKEEDKEPKKEEKDDDDELELKEPDEEIEKLDLKEDDDIEIDTPPRKKDLLKDYPDIFKKHPFLEKMLYRDRQYTELFGSFDDAKELSERAEVFSQFETQLLDGNTEDILRNVKETDTRAFNMIVDDYLPTLAKVDKDAYFHVTGNLNRRLIMEMVQEANSIEKEDSDRADLLKQTALVLNQFIFGSSKFTNPSRLTEREDKKVDDKVEQERINFVKERFETARDDLQSQVDNTLRATISDYIDPKGSMSSYVKKNAVNDAMKYLGELISTDDSVIKNLDKLWRSAVNDHKFSKDSLGKIKSYYLSKAKGNLKQAILKARSEALKDLRPANRDKEVDDTEDREEETSHSSQRRIPTGKPSQPKSKNDEMKKGESVADFFSRD